MPRPRSQMLALSLFTSAALLLGCGGEGGGDVKGEDDGRPRIERLDPDRGPVGSDVLIHGENFAQGLANNVVRFNGTVSSTLEVDPERKWVRTRVPSGATTGPITMQVDLGTGQETIEGPIFTVNDDRPQPTLTAISPSVATLGFTEQRVNLNGGGFVDSSRVIFNGEELDATRTGSTMLSFTVPAEAAPTLGSYEVQVINDPPGGGASEKLVFQVVTGMRFLEAVAQDVEHVLLRFDRPIRLSSVGGRNPFRIAPAAGGRSLEIEEVMGVQNDPNSLMLQTRRQGTGVDYVVTIQTTALVSVEGGKLIGDTSLPFRSFYYPPVHVASFGSTGCDAATFSEPVSIRFAGSTGYVTEASGNQVQLFELAGEDLSFGGFLGNDGSGSGLHAGASVAIGCPAELPEIDEALAGPRGAVGIDEAGGIYVASTEGGEVIHLDAAGTWTVLDAAAGEWTSAVLLGSHGDKVFFAGDDGILHIVDPAAETKSTYGRPGVEGGRFDFGIAAGGTPSMALNVEDDIAYITEPGNHRVHRVNGVLAGRSVFAGVIGKGSDFFDRELDPFPVPGPGTLHTEFTRPSGIVVLPDGTLLVADEAKGGRLQKFEASGLFREEKSLDYRPGGMALDSDGYLWITDPDNDRIHRYSL